MVVGNFKKLVLERDSPCLRCSNGGFCSQAEYNVDPELFTCMTCPVGAGMCVYVHTCVYIHTYIR